jgi:type III pantothenate kinase
MDAIVIDIGNTNVALGLFLKDTLDHVERLPVGGLAQLTERIRILRQRCGAQPLGARTVPVVVSSVNPPVLAQVERAVNDALDQQARLIGRDVPVGIKYAVENPERVGTDRLLCAAAAYDVVGDAVVVADLGSATTVDVVSHQGIFLGGAILPGLRLGALSLHEHTAQLPMVEPAVPKGDYPTNTVAAIEHGLYYGAIGALRALVERFATLLGRWPQVVMTGGYARMLAAEADFVDNCVPDLVLSGIFLAWKKYLSEQQEQAAREMGELEDVLGGEDEQD